MGANVKSVRVSVSVVLAVMLLCNFSETRAPLLVLCMPNAPGGSQESLCRAQGIAVGYKAKKKSMQT